MEPTRAKHPVKSNVINLDLFDFFFFNQIEQRDDNVDTAIRIQPCATILEQHVSVVGALKSWLQVLSFT